MSDCRALRAAADALRFCTGGGSNDERERLEIARWEASVTLRRCTCTEVPAAVELSRRAAGLGSPFDLAIVELMADHAEQCTAETSAAERRALAEVRAKVRQSRTTRAYCRGATIDWRAVANATVQTCDDARLERAALSYWNACPAASTDDRSLRETMEFKEAIACVSSLGSSATAPDCDIVVATANRLRQRASGDDPRLWNLIATQAIAASGAQATAHDRGCAARVMANDIAADRLFVESILQDPDLRKRLLPALRRAFKDSTRAKELVRILERGTDIRAVIEKASTLSADKQRLFFSIVGAVGRMAEAARAVSAYEQNARAFDLVVAPRGDRCANGRAERYEDFSHVFVAGFLSAEPANVVFEEQSVDHRRAELLAARTSSCGTAARDPAAGPGCGAVISLQLDRRRGDRAAGTVKLQFVVPGDEGRAVTSETAIEIPEFEDACGTSSEEVAAASRIAHGVLFKFAKAPGDTVIVKDRPVPVEICGLRAIPPEDAPTTRFDHKGIRVQVLQGDTKLAGPATGARAAMQAWKYTIGETDAREATAILSLSWGRYEDDRGGQAEQLVGDLFIGKGSSVASFKIAIMDDPDCRARLEHRYTEAGRMIGNQVGSFIAYSDNVQKRPPRLTESPSTGTAGAGQPAAAGGASSGTGAVLDPAKPATSRCCVRAQTSETTQLEKLRPAPRPRRWKLPLLLALDAAAAGAGFLLVRSSVDAQNFAAAHGLEPPNRELQAGQTLLITAAIGTLIGGILAVYR